MILNGGHGNTFADAFAEAFDAQRFRDAFRSGFQHGARLQINFVSGFLREARLLIGRLRNLRHTAGTEVDNHSGTLAQFRVILEEWNGRLVNKTLESLARQLPYLLEDEEELAALSCPPDAVSFRILLKYLAEHPLIKAPSLTLTRKGVFVGHWRPAANAKARLSIDFLDKTRARWSAIDARDTQAPTMTGGICPVSDLDEHLLSLPGLVPPLKGDPLPDEDHVIRQCSGTAIERDAETQQPIGVTKDAFDDDDPDGLSVTWVEYFARSADPDRAAMEAVRASPRTVRPSHRFGKFNVGLIKAAGTEAGIRLD